ncbi:MAG TPA: methyltransferase domain-containing protein [Candidatus Binataceae bacterium]
MDSLDVERVVRERYSQGAAQRQDALCCPIEYDPRYLEAIPREVLERDYGCGDPTRDIAPGEQVLDLGSGGGKVCFIAAQIVGPQGRVIGVDANSEMLSLARRSAPEVGAKLGFANVEFRRGRIEDLSTDLDAVDDWLGRNPIRDADGLDRLNEFIEAQRRSAPLVAADSIDVVVSNCVLNLVRESSKPRIFAEVYRVLKRGGRAVISDIVSDEPVPAHLRNDPELWSGCVSGAMEQGAFLAAFERAGFHGIEILKRDVRPWRTVEGIEFRSITVRAMKGKQGACWDCNQAVIYRGPWRQVEDDDGHTLVRGQPMAVCEKTYRIYTSEPYAGSILPVAPLEPVALEDARPFDCSRDTIRHPRETKGVEYRATSASSASCCGPEGGCE